jgi:hypothetical protein
MKPAGPFGIKIFLPNGPWCSARVMFSSRQPRLNRMRQERLLIPNRQVRFREDGGDPWRAGAGM